MSNEVQGDGWFNKVFSRVISSGTQVRVNEDRIMESVRTASLFSELPAEQLEAMLGHMDPVVMKTGDTVINEGAEGDYFYVLIQGKADVLKRTDEGSERVAGIEGLCSFGEEALISNARRNATIKMSEGGLLIRLSKDDFTTYVKEPMLQWASPMEAKQKSLEGGVWLDARDAKEYQRSHMRSAVSLPLNELRERVSTTLNSDTAYICYCDNGRRSSAAAFLLRQRGYDVTVLRGGLNRL